VSVQSTGAGGQQAAAEAPPDADPRHDPVSQDLPEETRVRLEGSATPVWFEYLVVVAISGVLSFGGFGLFLAVLGHYRAGPTLLVGAAGTVAGTVLGRPARRRRPSASPSQQLPTVVMCLVAAGVGVWNAVYAGHHVAVDRDPGVYTAAGRWLAAHGTLVVPGGTPWVAKNPAFNWASAGMYPHSGGTLQFQFAHLTPVLLAEAHRLGGDTLMFRVPALLGSLALLAVYAVGTRLIRRPWLVVAAVTALGVSLPQLYVSRDTFSEPATQILLWGGIWLLLRAYQELRVTVGLLAGLAVGGTLMTRIDGVAYLITLPLLGAVGWLAAGSGGERRSVLRVYGAVVAGVIPPAVLGTIDVQRRSGLYYSALHGQVEHLYQALGLSLVLAVAAVLLWPLLTRPVAWLNRRRGPLSVVAASMIGFALLWAWSLRPAGPSKALTGVVATHIGQLQKAENVPVRPETYAEQTMQWISWYVGPIALILAIGGLCLLTVLAIRRGTPAVVTVLAMAAPLTIIYLWNPNITPEQVWAMRRYVPASLPLLVLAAAAMLDGLASVTARLPGGRNWPRLVVAAGAVGLIAFPLGTSLPVGKFQTQANYLPTVDRTCAVIGPTAAVIFSAQDYDAPTLMQTLRSWCNVPVTSVVKPISSTDLQHVAQAFRAQGRTLWVLGSNPTLIRQVDPGLNPVLIGLAKSPRELAQTVNGPPENYAESQLSVYGSEVPS
jgi:hypothetical protein